MGYKLGKFVNVGYNPSFEPSTTDQYSATGGATMVVGESNTVKGINNFVVGKDNIMHAAASECIIAGTGNQVSGSSFGISMFGYINNAQASAAGATVAGLGSVVGGNGPTAIGYTATGTGFFSAAIGRGTASGYESVAIGASTASQTQAIGIGGSATAARAVAIGSGSQAQTSGAIAIGRGSMGAGRLGGFRLNANGGQSSTSSYQICQSLGNTLNATPTKIYLAEDDTDGNLIIDTRTCVHFEVIVQGTNPTSSTVGCIYKFEGVVNRANSASDNPAFLGSVSKTVIHESDAAMDAAITINNTNKCLDLEVTGIADTELNWMATWHLHQNQ